MGSLGKRLGMVDHRNTASLAGFGGVVFSKVRIVTAL
jgi:hypothetical protein